jgi:hypothetical protein
MRDHPQCLFCGRVHDAYETLEMLIDEVVKLEKVRAYTT